jgi:predicted Zn-dependent protease
MLTRDQARALCDRVLARRTLDHLEISLGGGTTSHLRFARGEPTTSGVETGPTLTVRAIVGRRHGSASTNQLDDESLARVVRRAEEIAGLAPEDPELVPPLGPTAHPEVDAFDGPTAERGAAMQADGVAAMLAASAAAGVAAAGFASNAARFDCRATSAGLFAWHVGTSAYAAQTARTASAAGSGWGAAAGHRVADLDYRGVAARAIAKAIGSEKARPLPAGAHPAVLEPSCVADLAWMLAGDMDQRRADEGRSFFARAQAGAALFDPAIELVSDPADPRAPVRPWSSDGLPQLRRSLFDRGRVSSLTCDRFWAGKTGKPAVPPPANLLMKGGSGSLDDLVRSTRRGVLVTSLWYIRSVDPQTLLYTGLTRDGVFWIEDGVVAYPVNNFRWNDSPVALFKQVEAMSAPVRAAGREAEGRATVVPAIRVGAMTFSSVSDAV